MIKKFHLIITLVATALALTSCHDEPAPVVKNVERSVLVYMISNNSLSGFDAEDINEMIAACKAGDLGASRLIVYRAPRVHAPELIEITAEGEKTLITYNDAPSSVTVEQMRRVIADFKKLSPADKYGLILWSHASGWIQNGIDDPNDWELAETKSFGDDGGKYMNITALGSALSGEGFDYIYFDCCYMASVEALYQLRDCADHFIGSTTILPSEGMPYQLSLKYLMPKEADVVKAAQTTFEYFDKQSGWERSSTMSVIKADQLQTLAEATADIYRSADRPDSKYRPQRFMTSGCYLFDFENYIDNFQNVDPKKKTAWKEAFDNAVIYSAATPRIFGELQLEYHCGLSTYIMNDAESKSFRNYDQLEWWHRVASCLFTEE